MTENAALDVHRKHLSEDALIRRLGPNGLISADGQYAVLHDYPQYLDISIYHKHEGTWIHQAKLRHGDLYANYINADGSYFINGSVEVGGANGVVNIYVRHGTNWLLQDTLTDTAKDDDNWFGGSVAISDDGSYAIVGAPGTWSNFVQYCF